MLFILLFVFFFPLSTVKPSPELKPFYTEYTAIIKEECPEIKLPKKISMGFGTLSMDEIGVCTIFFDKRQIVIDKTYWEMAVESERKQLIFHELTHCILNFAHIEDPNNYMNPYLMPISNDTLIQQVRESARVFCKDQ